MKKHTLASVLFISLGLVGAAVAEPTDRGRYLVQTSGCNDCHTHGYMQVEGRLPPSQWLTGSSVGYQGPWGTTYAVNLRLYMQNLSEAQWLVRARQPMRPPMPWFNLREFSDQDLIAIYRFVRGLGPAGEAAPLAVEPGKAVATPYFEFVPKTPAKVARQ